MRKLHHTLNKEHLQVQEDKLVFTLKLISEAVFFLIRQDKFYPQRHSFIIPPNSILYILRTSEIRSTQNSSDEIHPVHCIGMEQETNECYLEQHQIRKFSQ